MYTRDKYNLDIASINDEFGVAKKLNSLSIESHAQALEFLSFFVADDESYERVTNYYYSSSVNMLAKIKNDEIREKLFDSMLSEAYFNKIFKHPMVINNFIGLIRWYTKKQRQLEGKIADLFVSKLRKKVFEEDSLKHFMSSEDYIGGLTDAYPVSMICYYAEGILLSNNITNNLSANLVATQKKLIANANIAIQQSMLIEEINKDCKADIASLALLFSDISQSRLPLSSEKLDLIALWLFDYYADRVAKYNSNLKYEFDMSELPPTKNECINKALYYFKQVSPDNPNYKDAGIIAAGLRGYLVFSNNNVGDLTASYHEFEEAINEYFIARGKPHPHEVFINEVMEDYWNNFWKACQGDNQNAVIDLLNDFCKKRTVEDPIKIEIEELVRKFSNGESSFQELEKIIDQFDIPINNRLLEIRERAKNKVETFAEYVSKLDAKDVKPEYREYLAQFGMWSAKQMPLTPNNVDEHTSQKKQPHKNAASSNTGSQK